ADLGREVGERREVVPEHGGLAREPIAGELHAVTRVTREADDHGLEVLDLLGAHPGQPSGRARAPSVARGGCPTRSRRRTARPRRPRPPSPGSAAPCRRASSPPPRDAWRQVRPRRRPRAPPAGARPPRPRGLPRTPSPFGEV